MATKGAMPPDSEILKEPTPWLTTALLVFHKVDWEHALNNSLTMKPKPISKHSQNLLKRWEEILKVPTMLLESIGKLLDTLTFITVLLWKPTLNKLPGNAKLINNVNATALSGLVQLKDSMIRSRSPNSKISDSLKLYLRTLLKVPLAHAAKPLSVATHIQESPLPASVKMRQYMLQMFVPTMVKIAYAPAT